MDKLKEIKMKAVSFSSSDVTTSQNNENAGTKASRIQSEYKKCFKKEIYAENFENLKTLLLQQKDYSPPALSEESFELVSHEGANLVVEHIPQEENKNKVRVFSISRVDGLPDRIKDFPNNAAEVSLRLKGALGLGTVKSKSTSTVQTAYDGSMLSLEKTNDKVTRIHLITNSFDFECKNQSCVCLTKEY